MSRNELSVFNGLREGWYLRHPLRWLKALRRDCRDARKRAIKGYCGLDWTNFNWWFCQVVPVMFREWADKGMGYPGRDPFNTFEEWQAWLRKIADQIAECDLEKIEESKGYDPEKSPEIEARVIAKLKETLCEMADHWPDLWD